MEAWKTMIAETLKKIEVGQPRTFAGLSVYPLTGDLGEASSYTVLDDALRAGTARVTETSRSGSVPELKFHNEGDRPVLVVDGEELAGAKQNRIVNLTILVPGKSEIVIPVSCVEAGRWASVSDRFDATPQFMYARARSGKAMHVSAAMRMSGSRASNQGAVWDDIGQKQRELRSTSPTARMTDTFEQNRASLEDYVRNLPLVDNQAGAVFALAGKVSSVELFDSPATLTKMWPKLVRSWALDALPLANRPHDVQPVDAARTLLADVAGATVTEHEALGLGTDLRFDGSGLSGGALVHDDRLLHLCVFRDEQQGSPGNGDDWTSWRSSRMARASRRRGA